MNLFGEKKPSILLEARLAKIETDLDALRRESRGLSLEYIELYDKVKRQMSRMAKRYAVDQKENGEELPEAPPDDGLDSISRSILQRRGAPRVKT